MKVSQIASILNTVTQEFLGESTVVTEDLSNIVDIGRAVDSVGQLDKYVNAMVDRIGKLVFVDRKYSGNAPSVLMDGWEYGATLEKITMSMPTATENDAWGLTNGTTYNQDVFYKPDVTAKLYSDKVTYEIPISITEDIVKSAFDGPEEMNRFFSMIYNCIDKTLTAWYDALIMRTINNFTATTIEHEIGSTASEYATTSTGKAVNLLKLYNDKFGTELTAGNCLYDLAFLKFASYTIMMYSNRMAKLSTLFNIGAMERFTPKDLQHLVLLDEFASASDVYLQSDTYHNELTKLPNYETVPYWQGSGEDYGFTSTSAINVKIKSADTGTLATITANGIIGVLFDRDALAVCNQRQKVTTHYNAKGDFINSFYKSTASYFNDTNENFVVFFVA